VSQESILQREPDGRLMAGRAGLSDEQASALDLSRHLVITAGAGSGKTRTLVRRYLRALCDLGNESPRSSGAPRGPEQIVVSTFTERAAAELRTRLRAELLAAIRELSDNPTSPEDLQSGGVSRSTMLRHLRNCHDHFDRARIGTFHSFCASILREHAGELGIDPGFGVLQGAAARGMLDEAVISAIETAEGTFESDGSNAVPDLRPLFRAMSRRDLIRVTTTWVEGRENLSPFRSTLEMHDDEALLQLWQERYAQGRLEALERSLEDGSPLVAELQAIQTLAESPGVDPSSPLFQACALALQEIKARAGDDPIARSDRVRAVLGPFRTQEGKVRKQLSAGRLGDKQSLRDAKEHWAHARTMLIEQTGEACEALDELLGPADRMAGPVLRALRWLGDEAIRRYQHAKSRAYVLDFADLQLNVLRLLRGNPAVLGRLQSRFSHFMIDEFQDTNGIQWAILRLLCDDFRETKGLFLVGDPKQAIYRFRGGDVTLFDRAIREVSDAGGAIITFSANYRSQPNLIRAFNSLFEWLMDTHRAERPAWEAPFEHLTALKKVEPGSNSGEVQLLWLGEPSSPEEGTHELPGDDVLRFVPHGEEAWAVAAWLRDRHLKLPAKNAAVQAAVLVRRRQHLPTYAMALRRAGVPAAVVGGRGFFGRQEVHDITNLLLALAHNDDVVSLLGALRGPYLDLADEWLLWLVRLGSEAGSWALRVGWDQVLRETQRESTEATTGWNQLPNAAQLALRRAAQRYLGWQQARTLLPVSEFVRQILDDSAGTYLFAKNDPTGQTLANVEKLVAVAADYDSLGPNGVADFALYLREQEELEADEGDAPLDELAPVVLMTIHQSKGLEFPTVVLPDLHQPLRKGISEPLVLGRLDHRVGEDDLWEPAMRLPVEAKRRTMEPTLLRKLVARRAQHEDIAESRRLLYVAMTRAQDNVVCVAPEPRNKKPRGRQGSTSWEEWLRSWLAEQQPEGLSVFEGVDPWNPTETKASAAHQHINNNPPTVATQLHTHELRHFLQPILSQTTRILSPHALAAPKPEKAETLRRRAQTKRGAVGAKVGRLRGTLVHSCLEDGITEPGRALRRRVDQQAIASGLWQQETRDKLLQDVEAHLLGFRKAAPPELCDPDNPDVLREVPFRLPIASSLDSSTQPLWMEGVIDVLYRDAKHQLWVVLDYKTDHRDPDTLVADYSDQVLAYAWAASRILPELRDGQWQLAAELLMTAHGECRRVFGPEHPGTVSARFSKLVEQTLNEPNVN